jgi:hypothetical protein
MSIITLIRVVALCLGSVFVALGVCTTPSNWVYCSNCPQQFNNCYPTSLWSHSVFGTVLETWCNTAPDTQCVQFCSVPKSAHPTPCQISVAVEFSLRAYYSCSGT